MKHRNIWIVALVVSLALAAAFFMGGAPETEAPKAEDTVQESPQTELPMPSDEIAEPPIEETAPQEMPEVAESIPQKEETETAAPPVVETPPETEPDRYHTDPIPEGKPVPVEPQETEVSEETFNCTISISCATILDNMADLTEGKEGLIPADGWILQPVTVSFNEGESVFDVLKRVCMEQKIHMEFMDTPMYNSAYIEGIANLYEFDCGPLSGWMYKVNDWFPNYGCSRYGLKDGDVVCWVYTCDLGADVGDNSMGGQQP